MQYLFRENSKLLYVKSGIYQKEERSDKKQLSAN